MKRKDVIEFEDALRNETPQWLKDRLEWFQDLKFGLILHWGPYALWDCCESWPISLGDDWARNDNMKCWTDRDKDFPRFQQDYWNLAKQFNPVKFNPEVWASLAKTAGAKYLAFTTKHHDGFCMWDTATTNYKITGDLCPFHTDPRADLFKGVTQAFQDEGLAISAYYSKADWHCPYYWDPAKPAPTRNANTLNEPATWAKFVRYTHDQIREIMTGYGKIDILWLDAGWVRDEEDIDMAGMAQMGRELQPGLIMANRTVGDEFEDFITPEHQIPEEPLSRPWESCLVMAQNWKYDPNDVYKPTQEILEMLVDIVSKGGNLLLGIGPTPEGEFPPQAQERLKEIGAWMDINSEGIYGSRAIAPYKQDGVRFTQRDGFVYGFASPGQPIILESLKPKPGSVVTLLGSDERVILEADGDHIKVHLPASAESLMEPYVIRFELT